MILENVITQIPNTVCLISFLLIMHLVAPVLTIYWIPFHVGFILWSRNKSALSMNLRVRVFTCKLMLIASYKITYACVLCNRFQWGIVKSWRFWESLLKCEIHIFISMPVLCMVAFRFPFWYLVPCHWGPRCTHVLRDSCDTSSIAQCKRHKTCQCLWLSTHLVFQL